MSIYDVPIKYLDGRPADLHEYKGKALLMVNVASRCGFTPQYTGLQKLQDTYEARGFSVLGFPCNQFLSQEPGTPEEIAEFCSATYGVSFPIFEKIDVNGEERHPLYQILTETRDTEGKGGDVMWNFEKYVVSPEGDVVARFRTQITPEDPSLTETIEAQLPD